MDLKEELLKMRAAYRAHPLKYKILPRPAWLNDNDALSLIYAQKDILFSKGNVYYACIVMANERLYKSTDRSDCPACFIYTADPEMECDLLFMEDTVDILCKYSNLPEEKIPEHMKEIVSAMNDDHDRSQFIFNAEKDGKSARMFYICSMIFREDIPFGRLKSKFIPILAAPTECTAALLLPKKYWTDNFRIWWDKGGQQ